MKIAVVSDNHWHPCPTPEADFFIHCGDMTCHGSFAETASLLYKVQDAGYEAGIFVPGNHDWCFDGNRLALSLFEDSRFRVLMDQSWIYKGIKFWGSPWTPPFMNWALMRTEDELRAIYTDMPEEIDVLITHGPPYGILDDLGTHVGSYALREAVEVRRIKHHVFGHIHECGGQTYAEGGTIFHNVAICNGKYQVVREPLILEL